jgi:thiosulfate reductase cytochrome b subunit
MLGLFPLQIATGILLMDIGRFTAVIEALGGLALIDELHVIVSFALVAFLFVHVYLVTLGATPLEHIRSMVTGYKLTRGDVPTSGTAGPAVPGGTGLR